MPIRVTGMVSGMDTESIIQQLVSAKSQKVTSVKKSQIKASWKQDAWKELNNKLKKFHTKYANNMRFQSSYSKKTTKVSDSSVVSVITGDKAMNSVQDLTVNKMAKTAYLTGSKIETSLDKVTALTKLSELGFSETAEGTISFASGDKSVDLKVTGETTINDVLNSLKEAGLNANFDEAQKRFFVSAKESGAAYDFGIVAKDADGLSALSALGLQTSVNATSDKATYDYYKSIVDTGNDPVAKAALVEERVAKRVEVLFEAYQKSSEQAEVLQDRISDLQAESENDSDAIAAEIDALQKELESLQEELAEFKKYINVTEEVDVDGEVVKKATATDALRTVIGEEITQEASFAASVLNTPSEGGAHKVNAQDAEITLNGATFTSSKNTFEVNGLTLTVMKETAPGEKVTLTTDQDTEGIYDMVKEYLKEYNALVNEMDKLYNAASAKKFEPLLSEEKEEMSETEIEEWEKKIKDALLRRDDSLSAVNSALQLVMSTSYTVNGKAMSLMDFGIGTLGYFEAADNEKHALHIDGDEDDEAVSGKENKLKALISTDPDSVIDFFTQLSQDLYTKMSDLSKSKEGYRSFGSFYDDKKMKTDYDSYASKISEAEQKLNDYEDKWYKKFASMETALAKLQSKTNAVTGFFGS